MFTDYLLDGQSVVQEIKGGATTTYFNGLRGPECRIDSSGNARWNIFDGLGSAVQEVDGAGNVTVVRDLDVYGLLRSPESIRSGETSGKHKFVGSLGHTDEGETGLIYMRARYMDPALGRFISEDPAYDGVNWYVYCNNNPVAFVDANGRNALLVVAAVAVLGGLAACFWGGSWTIETFLKGAGYALISFLFIACIEAEIMGLALATVLSAATAYGFALLTGESPDEAVFSSLMSMASTLGGGALVGVDTELVIAARTAVIDLLCGIAGGEPERTRAMERR